MTSTAAVQNEIQRFLKSIEPEVLCIVGDWGVGKTYNWQANLERLKIERSIGLSRYSYVSLFGINSLDNLKSSIFENLEFLVPEGESAMDRLVSGGNKAFRNAKRYTDLASAAPFIGNAISKFQPHLFSAVRNQILCIDDLERRGNGLNVKDVLGLVSFLREQRGCKVALLLNEGQLDKEVGAKEFGDYFEKVIDTKLVFAPTAEEAVGIAINGKDDVSKLTAEYCTKLRISNIRVMKKIERLLSLLMPVLKDFDKEIIRQVVHSTVMFGWSKFDTGANPPPLDYLKVGSMFRYIDRKNGKAPSKDETRWDSVISSYELDSLDAFDHTLLEFVKTGILDIDEITLRATEANESLLRRSQAGSFEGSWRCFHDSFADNEDEVCSSLLEGVKKNFDILGLSNVDDVVGIFRDLEREQMADSLVDLAIEKGSSSFWLPDDPFNRQVKDRRLHNTMVQRRKLAKPALEFEEDLVKTAQTFDREKIAQLAQVPTERYRDLFDSRSGEQLRRVVLSALEHRKISNASDDQIAIVRKAEEALREIGSRSRLNALRVRKYGISISTGDSPTPKIDQDGEVD